ncbi:MAG TPA: AarF/ABC1/UbiB kinase family protein [Anaerolineae bacterium]|jgi:predicted unusual protein kinase regulating ubiquinone biosynthesis (AarF/ABC1/UbiB family)|nr:AarF/ABC1/UbiB kinase family protein [Anaerolineae bacterium]
MTTVANSQTDAIDRRRYRKILWFFAGVIGHLVWWDLFWGRIFKKRIRASRPARFRRMSRRFRVVAVEMGGVMIKLGQFLSARVDILPPEITEELAGLQDEVPAVPFKEIRAVLEGELGDVSAHFAHFEPEPLAAASLGQAHVARLAPAVNSGARADPVVVKVQRPNIENIVSTDLSALRVVARWAMRYRPIRRRADVPALMDEFASTMWEELDYISEADNAERFAEIFADRPEVRIPLVHRQHSTHRVLVLEDVHGIKVTDVAAMAEAGIDQEQVALNLLDAYFYQIFMIGFFHADPHPGNLFVRPVSPGFMSWDGKGQPFQIAFVDFGMVGHIEELMGDNLRRVLVSVTQRDARGLTEAYDKLGFFLPGSDLDRIAEAQEAVLDHLWGRNLLELSQPDPEEMQELSREFRDILFEFPFQVPHDFIFLGRALGMLSGLASQLDPNINPWQLVEQYGQEIIRSRQGLDLSLATIGEWVRILYSLPGRAERILTDAEYGRLRVQSLPDRAQLRRLDRIERKIGQPNWSLMSATLIVSGTLLYVNDEIGLAWLFWGIGGLFFILALIRRF